MGGSSGAVQAKPIQGYDSNLRRTLGLSGNLVNASIASTPELRSADLDYLQRMAAREAEINARTSADLEARLNPDLARARAALNTQVADDLEGGPSAQLSNQWLRSGLQDVIATGAGVDGSFARSALADSTRRDYYADRDRTQAKAAALLQANPLAETGLDVGSLATLSSQAKTANADARDAYKANNLNFMGAQAQNVLGAFQQAAQMEAQRRSGNAAAQNAARGAASAQSGATTGATLGAVGAIGGAALLAF